MRTQVAEYPPAVRPSVFTCVFACLPALLACTVEQNPNAGAAEGQAQAEGQAAAGEQKSPAKDERAQLLSNEVLDLGAVLAKSPEQAETVLGKFTRQTERESSCVRFVPDRVFYRCKHDIRTYDHPKLGMLVIDYQDGRAAEIQLSGLPGTGAFSYDAALGTVGLVLPGEPHHSNPPAGNAPQGTTIDTWDWSNGKARLLAEGRQFRVRVSVVDDDWARSKVELLDNTPLTDQEKTRIMPVKGDSPVSQ